MATVLNDILRLTLTQKLFDQNITNVFFYRVYLASAPIDISSIVATFASVVLADVNAIQTTEVTNERVDILNITNDLDFYTQDISGEGGDYVDTAFSPNAAFGFTLIPESRIVRKGSKRFAGVGETQVTQGKLVSPDSATYLAVEAALASNVACDLEGGGTGGIRPCIVGRDATGAYDLNRVGDIVEARLNVNVTTQNSRKFGRGS